MYIRVFKTFINILSVLLICLFVVSCRFNSSYINREEDKRDAEQVIAQFYELLKNHQDYKGTYRLFDKRFFEVTDTQKLNEIYDITFEKLGNVENYDIEKWETEAIVGANPKTNYVFLLNVKRSNYTSKEQITLLKEKDDIKVISYHVNSDGLFKK
jgi:hypothetical protein